MQQSVDQRAAGIARTGVHNQAGWFVHHNDVFVFIEDV